MGKPACILALIGLQALLSCGPPRPNLPVSEEKLVDILIDVHVAEAALQPLRGHTKDSVSNVYYDQIYQIHKVSRDDFEASMMILKEDPKRLEALYTRIMTEMERQDAELEGKE